MPPKGPLDPVKEELEKLKTLAQAGLISTEVMEEKTRQVLGLPAQSAMAPGRPPVTVEAEDPTRSTERRLLAQVTMWVGSPDAPFVGTAMFEALVGKGSTEYMRDRVADITTSTPLYRRLHSMFVTAGVGVSPVDLQGSTNQARIARMAAWTFLSEILCVVACEICLPNSERAARQEFKTTLKELLEQQLDDTAPARLNFLAGIGKLKSATQAALKGLGESKDKERRDKGKPHSDPPAPPASRKRPADNGIKSCHYCKQPGHEEKDCNKKKADRASGKIR